MWSCFNGGVGIVARAGVVWNGDLVVVGDFWNNFQPCVGCNGLAVWNGSAWTPLDQGFNNDVLTVTVYNGDLIVGGDFTEANGVPCSRVVRWNTTTSTFESKMYEQVVKSSADGVVLLKEDGTIQFANDVSLKRIGMTLDEIKSKSAADLEKMTICYMENWPQITERLKTESTQYSTLSALHS